MGFRRLKFYPLHSFLLVFVLTFFCTIKVSEAEVFTMAFGDYPNNNPQFLFYEKIYTVAFERLGYEFKYKVYPSKRASELANSGKVDGEPQRVRNYNSRYENMIRVEEVIFQNRTLVYAMDNQATITNLQDLMGTRHRVDYILGSLWSERVLSQVVSPKYLSSVLSIDQGFKKLKGKRSDFFVALEAPSKRVLSSSQFKDYNIVVVGVLGENASYPFVHRSHGFIAHPLSEILKEMKAQGEYEEILFNIMPYLKQ